MWLSPISKKASTVIIFLALLDHEAFAESSLLPRSVSEAMDVIDRAGKASDAVEASKNAIGLLENTAKYSRLAANAPNLTPQQVSEGIKYGMNGVKNAAALNELRPNANPLSGMITEVITYGEDILPVWGKTVSEGNVNSEVVSNRAKSQEAFDKLVKEDGDIAAYNRETVDKWKNIVVPTAVTSSAGRNFGDVLAEGLLHFTKEYAPSVYNYLDKKAEEEVQQFKDANGIKDKEWQPFMGSGAQMLFPTSENEIQAKATVQERVIEKPVPKSTFYEDSDSAEYESQYSDNYSSSPTTPQKKPTPKSRNRNGNSANNPMGQIFGGGRCGAGMHGPDITTPNPQSCY